jgi:hypothetical protein
VSDINPILDAIDNCLADFSVGADAMRWSPDAPDPTPVHWSEQEQYARPVSTGPEPVQATGLFQQQPGLPPLTPENLRQASIRYVVERYGVEPYGDTPWRVVGSMTQEQAHAIVQWGSEEPIDFRRETLNEWTDGTP